ncbi:MAG TPA: ABC transporter ATP-binding protein [Spirochaetota bacterium]|nr:ABC transporter ATP-binding protein [Spirochaetota bacterium]HOL57910.1 ABC transporter ATP-binding protein [Spirochaetota bacterium]HPP04772.1 ABC transporter ATP-binding protein [Spirochaetota bacterium]
MEVIKTKDLYKDYVVNKIVVNALRGVDFVVKKKEFTAIVGPSGSGKSTLLHLIGCLDTLTKGEIYLNEKNISSLTKDQLALLRREKIGFIFQAYNLIPVLTVLENVIFPLTLLGVNPKEAKNKALELLKIVGLEGMEKRKPKEISGGQQQRVAIARALIKDPELVLADEPTANLDSKTGSEILDLMLKLNTEKGITFVFSTHDQMVMEYAKRLVFLRDGKIIKEEIK